MELHVTDMHTAGEPVRIVTGGYPELTGPRSSTSGARHVSIMTTSAAL